MNRALLQRPPLVLLAGGLLGGLLLLVVPSSWLFREPPITKSAMGETDTRYACPMFCTMAEEEGPCPVCGMDMEPVTDQGDQVVLGRRQRYMVGVRTALVHRATGVHRLRALGHIRHDERLMGHVTAWVSGRLDRLFVDFTGTTVKDGDRVAEIYAPELVSAQEELLTAHRAQEAAEKADGPLSEQRRRDAEALYDAARRRLLLLGLPESLVRDIQAEGKARDRIVIRANVGGSVLIKHVNTGDYVKTGQKLFTVVDLTSVWAMLDVFEEDAGAVFVGQQVEIAVPSLPGERFAGELAFVDPVLDEKRRVLGVRVDLDNPAGRLKPGTFVDASILVQLTSAGRVFDPAGDGSPGQVLLLPRSAVLDGGDRKIVYVMTQEPGPLKDGEERWPAIYQPREVQTGFRVGDEVVVLVGLEEGDEVVTRGQFLIDSKLQLTGKPSFMIPEASAAPIDPHAGHSGH